MPVNYKKYPANWKVISHEVRFLRAGGKCESCGAKHMVTNPFTKRKIVIACVHLDGNRNSRDRKNLRALCQRCHLLHDQAQHIYSRRYGKETRYYTGLLFKVQMQGIRLRKRPRKFSLQTLFAYPAGIRQKSLFEVAAYDITPEISIFCK